MIVLFNCQKSNTKVPGIIRSIEQLPEYQEAEAKTDSLKAMGIKVSLEIGITKSLSPEDSAKKKAYRWL